MPSLIITLKQQTPLIHFQASEIGANLRATEVKPKLDKFLWEVEGENINSEWKISSDTDALAYKMRIDPAPEDSITVKTIDRQLDYTLYFNPTGNNPGEQPRVNHGYVLCLSTFNLTILSQHCELLEKIKKHIYVFFLLHNFGFRSSKGFGSYIVTKINNGEVDNRNQNYYEALSKMQDFENVTYRMTLTNHSKERDRPEPWLEILKDIAGFYAPLKSHYLSEQYITGDEKPGHEKEFMKGHFPTVRNFYAAVARHFSKPWKAPQERDESIGYRYFRALLGLADHFEFSARMIVPQTAKVNVKDPLVDNSGSNEDDAVIRFESPVFIKPYADNNGHWTVMILLKKIPKVMYGRDFLFSDKQGNKPIMKTPEVEEFNLLKLFEHYSNRTRQNTAGARSSTPPTRAIYFYNGIQYIQYTPISSVGNQGGNKR